MRVRAAANDDSMKRVSIAAVVLYLLLVPQQFNFDVAGILMSPYRVALLVLSIYIASSALKSKVRFAWPDLLVVLAIAWITLASYVTSQSLADTLVQGGSHLVDIGLAYFLARTTIQTPDDLRKFLILVAPGIIFTGVIVAAEAISHRPIIHPLASALTGKFGGPGRWDVRMGFMRGVASLPHPILTGIFLASFLPLYMFAGLRGWPKAFSLIASLLGAFTMSSAAMLGLVVGALLCGYNWLVERVANLTWKQFVGAITMLYIMVESSSNSGFYNLLVRYASLNSVSAYNRVLIWKYGSQNVADNPWFGIGYANWDRPDWMHSDSFDWFWLILALRFGIPVAILALGATLMGVVAVALRSSRMPPRDRRLLIGVAISVAVFALGLNSVSLWMASLAWFFMLLGLTVTLGFQAAPAPVPMRPMPVPAPMPGQDRLGTHSRPSIAR